MLIIFLLSVLFLDSIILPSLFGFYDSSLTSLFLISVILNFGIDKKTILFVFLSSLLVDFLLGHDPGLYSLSLLILVLIVFVLSRAFNIPTGKNSGIYSFFALSLLGVFLNYLLSFRTLSLLNWINLVYLVEVFLLLICLNLKKTIKFR